MRLFKKSVLLNVLLMLCFIVVVVVFFFNWSVMFAGVYQQSYLPSHDHQL